MKKPRIVGQPLIDEFKIRLSSYLLNKKIKKDLIKLCRDKNLSSSGNKEKLIDNITAHYSYQEILNLTKDLRLSGELNIDYELLSLKKEIGASKFNRIITLAPMSVSDVLMVSSLLDGSKRKAEIVTSSLFKQFLVVATENPELRTKIAERIIFNARKSLIISKIILQTPRTWEYSLNPQLHFYFQDFQVPQVEELYERVKQSQEEHFQLGIFFEQDQQVDQLSRVRALFSRQVKPAEQFTSSPGLLANYTGKLGEELAGRYLERKGYTVCRLPDFFTKAQGFELELALCPHLSCSRTSDEMDVICARHNQPHLCVTSRESSEILSSCPCTHQFPKVCEGCAKIGSCVIHEYFSLVSLKSENNAPKPFHSMDFLVHKNGEHFLVEVKTNSAQTKPIIQLDTIEQMQKIGLKSLLVLVNIPITNTSFKIKFARAL